VGGAVVVVVVVVVVVAETYRFKKIIEIKHSLFWIKQPTYMF
jgi:hypothetical protein